MLAPNAVKPFRCKSTGREPIGHPPGSGIFACPNLASSGPMIKKDARSLPTSSYEASSRFISLASMVIVPFS